MADDEKFLVVPLGKKSKAITQTVSNDTAMEIMELLADGPLATSKVAEKLGIPLTTAQYNIEKLMDAGLAKIAKTKYSEKGREVKLYEAMNRAIVILPGKSGTAAVMDALRRYLVLLPVALLGSLVVEYLVPLAPRPQIMSEGPVDSIAKYAAGSVLATAQPEVNAMPLPVPTSIPAPTALSVADAYASPPAEVGRSVVDHAGQSVLPYFQHAGVLFLAGCLLVLLLLGILEYARYRKGPGFKK